jgi:hypothetical protein
VKGVYMEFEALTVKRWFVVPKNSVRYRTNSQNYVLWMRMKKLKN